MSVNIGDIQGKIILDDQFTGILSRTEAALLSSADKIKKQGQDISELGGSLVRTMTAPLALIGGGAVTAFASFDDAMTSSLAIMGDVSDEMKDEMSQAARDLALTLKPSAKDAADSFFFLASAGLDAAASIEALPTVGQFAQAGLFDMARATDILTDAQSALGLAVKDDAVANMNNMVRVSDVLVKANTIANASVEQFGVSLTTKAGTAMKDLSIEIESGVAVLAAWADQGVKAELAGERFNIVTRDLQTAFINNKEEFEKYNIAVFDGNENFRNMADIVEDLEDALGGMSDEGRRTTLMQLGFTDRSVQATQSLIGLSDKIRKYEDDLIHAGGATEEVANKQMLSFSSQMGLVKDRIIDVGITLGESLVPVIQDVFMPILNIAIAAIKALAERFSNIPQPIQAVVVVLGTLAAAVGPILIVVGQLMTAWGTFAASTLGATLIPAITKAIAVLTGPVGWAIAAGVLLLSWKPVRVFLVDLGGTVIKTLVGWVNNIVSTVKGWWKSTEDGRKFLGALVRVIAADFVQALKAAWNWVSNLGTKIVSAIGDFIRWSGVLGAIRVAIDIVVDTAKLLWSGLGSLISRIADMVSGLTGNKGLIAVITALNPTMGTAIAKMVEWANEAKSAIDSNNDFSESSTSTADAVNSMKDAATGTINALSDLGEEAGNKTPQSFKTLSDAAKETKKSLDDQAAKIAELADALAKEGSGLTGALDDARLKQEAMSLATSQGVTESEALRTGLFDLALQVLKAKKDFEDGEQALKEYNKAQDDLKSKLDDTRSSLVNQLNSTLGLNAAIAGGEDSLKSYTKEQKALELATSGGLTAIQAEESGLLDLARQVVDAADKTEKLTKEQEDSKKATEELAQTYKDFAREAVSAISDVLSGNTSLGDSLEDLFGSRAEDNFNNFVDGFIDSFSTIHASGAGVFESIKGAWQESSDGMQGVLNALVAGFRAAAGDMQGLMIGAMSAIQNFASGNMLGGIISAIGVGIGLIQSFLGEARDKVKDTLDGWGIEVSEDLLEVLHSAEAVLGDAGAAVSQNLAKILAEVGIDSVEALRNAINMTRLALVDLANGMISSAEAGNTLNGAVSIILDNFESVGGTLADLNQLFNVYISAIDKVASGQLTAADATKFLEGTFADFVAVAWTLGSDGVAVVQDLVRAIQEAGLDIQAIATTARDVWMQAMDVLEERNNFLIDQAGTLVDSLLSMLNSSLVSTRSDIEFAAAGAIQAFNAMVAAGMPLAQAARELADLYDLVNARGSAMGIDLGDAFSDLGDMLNILAQDNVQRVINKLDGMAAAAQAAGNMGLLTVDQFHALSNTLTNTFQQLVDSGLSGEQALAALRPQLQILHDLQQQYGFAVGDSTQQLLDMALAQGVVQDAGLSSEDIMIRGFDNMLMALNELIRVLGGVPIAFEQWLDPLDEAEEDIVEDVLPRISDGFDNMGREGTDTFEGLGRSAVKSAQDAEAAWRDVGNAIGDIENPFEGSGNGNGQDRRNREGGFASGTGGFVNFPQEGSLFPLHGKEQVITIDEGQGVAGMVHDAIRSALSGGGSRDVEVSLLSQMVAGQGRLISAFNRQAESNESLISFRRTATTE